MRSILVKFVKVMSSVAVVVVMSHVAGGASGHGWLKIKTDTHLDGSIECSPFSSQRPRPAILVTGRAQGCRHVARGNDGRGRWRHRLKGQR